MNATRKSAGYNARLASHSVLSPGAVAALVLTACATAASACTLTVSGDLTISGILDVNDCVNVTATGRIFLTGSGTLILNGRNGNNTSTINGRIELQGSGSTLRIATNDHTFAGSGEIQGQYCSAMIYISAGKTLTNAADISGCLEIYGPGNFVNQGTVEANGSGTLKLAVGGTLDDSSAAQWRATAANAILKFDSSIGTLNSLEGEFVISGSSSAEIEVNQTLATTGRLNMSSGVFDLHENVTMGDGSTHFMGVTGGQIVVASGKTFTHY